MSYGRLWFGSSIRAEFFVLFYIFRSPSFWLYPFWVKLLFTKIQKHMEIHKYVICFGFFVLMVEPASVSDLSMSVFCVSGNVVFVTVCDLCPGGIVVVE